MNSVKVSLSDPMRDWVQSRVDSGRYASADEYVRDLIRRDQETGPAQPLSVADIRRSISASRKTGKSRPADEVFDRIEARLSSMD